MRQGNQFAKKGVIQKITYLLEKNWLYIFSKILPCTQYAEVGCYYQKKVRWKNLQIQKI